MCFVTFQVIKGCGRFKNKGLPHEDKLSKMFEDLRNTGDDHWSASTGVPPSPTNRSHENSAINIDEEQDDDISDDSEPEEVTPTSGKGKIRQGSRKKKGKKPKTSTGHWFQEQMSKIVEMNEMTTTCLVLLF
jgi:hypothetical protein